MVQVLNNLDAFAHSWVDRSVGPLEDAAVLRPPAGAPLVFTVDFITPIVDDPETYGAIAAANSISDVYAMGGEPQAALAVCGFPVEKVPRDVLTRIFRGGRDKAAEAGCPIVGGHTVKDPELKYGLCVIGTVDPDHVLTQTGAQAGDVLVLTKPLGFGVASQAIKKERLTPAQLEQVTRLMCTLNKGAKDAALAAGVRAATDITGFGFLNHLRNILVGSHVAARVNARAVPVLDFVPGLADAGLIPGGSKDNLAHVAPHCRFDGAVSERDRLLLADAQTSGGLLLTVPPARLDILLDELRRRAAPAHAVVGEITAGPAGTIEIVTSG